MFTLNQGTNENFGWTVDYLAGGFNNLPAIIELRNEIEQLRLGRTAATDKPDVCLRGWRKQDFCCIRDRRNHCVEAK